MVWHEDWTHVATPMYILLDDIFRGEVPAAYDAHTRVHLATETWREKIIKAWALL
jgi:hypothetical protein